MRAAGVLVVLAMLAACAAPVPALSGFERCVQAVAGATVLTSDRLKAAEWCATRAGQP